MSEQHDPFADIAAQLEQDTDFANRMAAANGQLDDMYAANLEPRPNTPESSHAYWAESINDVGQELYDIFIELCDMQGIDSNAVQITDEVYYTIYRQLTEIVSSIRHRLTRGDIIAVSNALGLNMMQEEDDILEAFGVPDGMQLVGTLDEPVVGPMPDEAYVIASDGERPLPIGIGLRLKDVYVINPYGEVRHDAFTSDVIIALGTVGLSLQKLHFTDEQ